MSMLDALSNLGVNEGGFGEYTLEDINALRKALSIGTSDPGVTRTGADPFRLESLDATLHIATSRMKHARLWNLIDKSDGESTIEEYNRLHSYGDDASTGFIDQADTTYTEQDSYQTRELQRMKFLATKRAVTHITMLTKTQPMNLMAFETMNGAEWMIQKVNRALYYGDSSKDKLEWDGLTKQISSNAQSVIDMRGGELTPEVLEQAAYLCTERYGTPECVFSNARVFADFSRSYAARQRFNVPPNPSMPGIAGTPMMGYSSLHGVLRFEPDVYVKPGREIARTGGEATHSDAPTAPGTVTAAVAAAGATEVSRFVGADVLYSYRVTALNRKGESIPSAAVDAAAVDANQKITLTIPATTGAYSYKIYRDEGGSSRQTGNLWFIGKVSPATVGASASWVDLNHDLPRTFLALVLDMSSQSLTFRQLLPLMKLNLARVNTKMEWLQLLYGTPIVFAPERNVVIKNIGYDKSISPNTNADVIFGINN